MTASALWFLFSRSLYNRLARQALRLRRPRYALGFLLGAAYLWAVFARPSDVGVSHPQPLGGAAGAWAGEIAALGLALLAARWWLFGGERTALAFSPAEVDFLFPAPLSRRQLIAFKLLRAQLAIVAGAALWTVLLARSGTLNWTLRAAAVWALFSTLHMHQLGASLVRASAAEQGAAGARRHALSIAVFAAAAVALAWSVAASVPALRDAVSRMEVVGILAEALRRPAAHVALLPFHWILAPSLAPDAAAWGRAMPVALALLLAHAAWVLLSDAAFEEAAVEASARRARRLATRGSTSFSSGGARRVWLPLRPTGPPEWAITWKNLVAQSRLVGAATVLRLLAGIAIGFAIAALNTQTNLVELLAIFAASWAALLLVAGPLWVRNDLRQDWPKLALLRTFPLGGAAIVGAEIAASTITLTLVQLAALAVALALIAVGGALEHATPLYLALACGSVIALPAVNAMSLCIQNGLALLYPDWGRRGHGAPAGIETLGLNLLAALGNLLLLLVALIVPGALAIGTAILLYPGLDAPGILIAAAVAAAALVAEIALCVRWLGGVFEQTEPGAA
ncbi:MAG: hypothetical protein M3373_06845 [Gemmatimonadota bacterium]|nr:hypothetical protein [Gemmatimonadota bacterium]